MNPIKFLENAPKSLVLTLGLLVVGLIAAIDYFIPPDISTSIFYIIPVCFTTWFASERAGIFLSIVSAIAWFVTNSNVPETDGQILPAIHYWNASVRLGFFLTISYLLSELKSALKREQKLIRTDGITGVANRRLFSELAIIEIKRSRRYGHPLTIAYIDIDDFKNINNYGGYKIGDLVLQTIAQTIKKAVRETDIIARMGGDEFALLLPGIGYETAQTVVVRVQNQLIEIMDENKWPATFSIGAITFINPPETVEDAIEKVDYLMYCIKNDGKNKLEHILEQGSF